MLNFPFLSLFLTLSLLRLFHIFSTIAVKMIIFSISILSLSVNRSIIITTRLASIITQRWVIWIRSSHSFRISTHVCCSAYLIFSEFFSAEITSSIALRYLKNSRLQSMVRQIYACHCRRVIGPDYLPTDASMFLSLCYSYRYHFGGCRLLVSFLWFRPALVRHVYLRDNGRNCYP